MSAPAAWRPRISLDYCPACLERVRDFDPDGREAESGQRSHTNHERRAA